MLEFPTLMQYIEIDTIFNTTGGNKMPKWSDVIILTDTTIAICHDFSSNDNLHSSLSLTFVASRLEYDCRVGQTIIKGIQIIFLLKDK